MKYIIFWLTGGCVIETGSMTDEEVARVLADHDAGIEGRKTYRDSNSSGPGIIGIRWKDVSGIGINDDDEKKNLGFRGGKEGI